MVTSGLHRERDRERNREFICMWVQEAKSRSIQRMPVEKRVGERERGRGGPRA